MSAFDPVQSHRLPGKTETKKKDYVFLQTLQTPLSVGLGGDYRKIIDIEKRVQQAVLGRRLLPTFVKKGVNIWFAVDNIDLLEDTPNRQNTFHGTVIVINQRNVDGEPVNKPLVIPEKKTQGKAHNH